MINGQQVKKHAEVTIKVIAPPFAGNCRALDALDGPIALVDGNYNAESRYKCSTVGNATAQKITIDCGNGTQHTQNNVSSLEATCRYLNVINIPTIYNITCVVDNAEPTPPACKQTLTINQSSL